MKKILPMLLLAGLTLLAACSKDDDEEPEMLSITPETVVSYVGKDWNTLADEMRSKKEYSYIAVDNDPSITASVMVLAHDSQTPSVYYRLTFNLDRNNQVAIAVLECADTLDIPAGNRLFLYYYERTFAPMANVSYKRASYDYDQSQVVEVNELVDRLRMNACPQPILNYRNPEMDMTASYFKLTGSDKGMFRLLIYGY